MTRQKHVSTFGSAARLGSESGLLLACQIASEVKNRWRRGGPPDVAAALAEYPELRAHRSVVLDLAYDEYRERLKAGESLDADQFSRRLPTFRNSLYLLIEVRRLLEQDSAFQATQTSTTWPEPGKLFLGFSLIAELGRGTFGRVFLASEPALGNRLVALKVAPHGGEEAEMLGKLQHPNIVPVYSVHHDAPTGFVAVCMPYLGRATLCDILDRAFVTSRPPTHSQVIWDTLQDVRDDFDVLEASSLDPVPRKAPYVEAIVHFAAQLADALAYAHSRGICHRDLKPSNVLVSQEGRPLLLDFNLSSDENVPVTRIGGTLPYMAPEQLRSVVLETQDHEDRADPRSDLFSLGIILYELLSGSLPFQPHSWDRPLDQIAEHLLRQQESGPEPVRAKNPQVDKALARLVHDCLAFDPEHRPKTAGALGAALRKQLSVVQRARRWGYSHPRRVSVLGSLLLALAVVGAGFLMLRDPYDVRQRNRGLQYLEQGSWESARDYLTRAIQAENDDWKAWSARGATYQKQGKYNLAHSDFENAFRLEPRPEIAACLGYCSNKLGYPLFALKHYQDAIRLGCNSVGVLNNMGFTCCQSDRPHEAERYLKQAIQADKSLQPAHHNLVRTLINQARQGRSVPDSALGYAQKALEVETPSAELYRDVGALYTLASERDPALKQQAVECLEKSVARGLDPASLKANPMFSSLLGIPEFRDLLAKPAPRHPSVEPDYLVDPLPALSAVLQQ